TKRYASQSLSAITREWIRYSAHNAFYVQQPISHTKTTIPVKRSLLYRVLAHCNAQGRAFAA
ncbi:hypothetical protein AB6896_00630, partial [Rahnella inusitata]|uniref:hypothetical protein n=1 Tax=Rahnella inusitata TaxID=58169 RepID=UPI0039BDC39C